MALATEVGLRPIQFVLDGDPAPFPKNGERAPQFYTHFYCEQTAGCIEMPLGMEVGLSPDDFVLDGNPARPQKGHNAQFWTHVYCGQMAVCIMIPLGTEVGLSLGDIVLHGTQLPLP